MRLLVVTQVLDTNDTYLGFFHRWIEKLAQRAEHVEAICLYEGAHALPENVHVTSLGKEKSRRPGYIYALRFLIHAWRLRKSYDAVFVHMNEEYVLVAGLLWKLLGKRVYLWRNHYQGSFLTGVAASLSDAVYYTSSHSYTARFKNAERMPVGVDIERFHDAGNRQERSILFFGRMSPAKRPDLFVTALEILTKRGVDFTASMYGSALPEHEAYRSSVVQRAEALGTAVHAGVPHEAAPDVFSRHDIYVNLAESGMFDKTLFEAAAVGTIALAVSDDWKALAGDALHIPDASASSLADALTRLLSDDDRARHRPRLRGIAVSNSLDALVDALSTRMQLH